MMLIGVCTEPTCMYLRTDDIEDDRGGLDRIQHKANVDQHIFKPLTKDCDIINVEFNNRIPGGHGTTIAAL